MGCKLKQNRSVSELIAVTSVAAFLCARGFGARREQNIPAGGLIVMERVPAQLSQQPLWSVAFPLNSTQRICDGFPLSGLPLGIVEGPVDDSGRSLNPRVDDSEIG